jgi:hypothetical protein
MQLIIILYFSQHISASLGLPLQGMGHLYTVWTIGRGPSEVEKWFYKYKF